MGQQLNLQWALYCLGCELIAADAYRSIVVYMDSPEFQLNRRLANSTLFE